MSKIINLLLLVSGLILTACGLAMLGTHPHAWLWLIAGIGLGVPALVMDGRRKRCNDQHQQAEIPARVDELMRQVVDRALPVRVPMPLRLVLFEMLALLGGTWMLYLGSTAAVVDWRPWIGGAFFLGLGLLALPYVWVGLGRPAIELSANGIATPKTGRIAWRDITGIYLRTVSYRGATSYVLVFRVNNFARAAQRILWTDRLLASIDRGPLFSGIVSAALPKGKNDPNVVYALARRLWKRSTGNDYDWNPFLSDQFNAALRRAASVAAYMQEPGAIEPSTPNLKKIEQQMAQTRNDFDLMRNELGRKRARVNLVMGVLFLLMLLSIAAPVMLRLLTD